MRIQGALTVVLVGAFALGAADAHADTVYMKNGRIITSESVRVEGDRVIIQLLDGQVAIPLSLVDHIVEDDAVEGPRSLVPIADALVNPNDPDDPANQGDASTGDPSQDDPTVSDPSEGDPGPPADPVVVPDPAPAQPAPAPEETREYWQNRVQPLKDQIAGFEREINRLGSGGTSADVLLQIQRLEINRDRVQDRLDAVRLDARRSGIPAGWAR